MMTCYADDDDGEEEEEIPGGKGSRPQDQDEAEEGENDEGILMNQPWVFPLDGLTASDTDGRPTCLSSPCQRSVTHCSAGVIAVSLEPTRMMMAAWMATIRSVDVTRTCATDQVLVIQLAAVRHSLQCDGVIAVSLELTRVMRAAWVAQSGRSMSLAHGRTDQMLVTQLSAACHSLQCDGVIAVSLELLEDPEEEGQGVGDGDSPQRPQRFPRRARVRILQSKGQPQTVTHHTYTMLTSKTALRVYWQVRPSGRRDSRAELVSESWGQKTKTQETVPSKALGRP
jgi:hypothetical protein